jgi:hypothetical protein
MDCERDHFVDEAAALAGWQAIAVEDQPQLPAAAGKIGKPEPFRNVIVMQLRVQPGRLGKFPCRIHGASELEIDQRGVSAAGGLDASQ